MGLNRPKRPLLRRCVLPQKQLLIPLLFSFASLGMVSHAEVANTNLSPEMVSQLLQRMDQLEQKAKRVDDLEAQVQRLKDSAAGAPEMPAMAEKWPKVEFSVQGDVNFHVSNEKGDKNTFAIGDIDPLIKANLSEKAKFVGEFAITSDNSFGDGFAVDIERAFAEYNYNDYLNIQAGRLNTSIGYYNNAFHNGTYFQTTVDRPLIYDYEDNDHGGILPVHLNGISINGAIPSGSLNLNYILEVGNGRSYDTNNLVFEVADNNDFKALNFALWAKPEWASGWQFGGSFYFDVVTPASVPRTDQY
ncbi:MAG TPA: hypothetical protein VF607_16435, partial [Verrucomicrobiae bacterium]